MFLLLFVSWLHLTGGLVQKETTLHAGIPSGNGASIYHNPETVTISNTSYNIIVAVQEDDYDIKLSLDNSWSFQALKPSTLQLTLDGRTPFPGTDTDFLIVFAINDWQYFSFFLHLDYTNNIKSRIYPSLDTAHISKPVSQWISDPSIHARWDRISNNGQWILPTMSWNKQALWPLQFVLTNNPSTNELIFQFYNNGTQFGFEHTFNHSCFVNTPIAVYIMGDSNGEQFMLSGVNVQSMYNDTTEIPTPLPTHRPTPLPSIESSVQKGDILVSIHYTITVTLTFEYALSDKDTNEVLSILEHTSHTIANQTCDLKGNASVEHVQSAHETVIRFVIHTHDCAGLQEQLIQNINALIEVGNLTIIITDDSADVIASESEEMIQQSTAQRVTESGSESPNRVTYSETEVMLWVIKLITVQLLLCCLMSLCVFTLRYRTKRLKKKRRQISNELRGDNDERHRNERSSHDSNASVTNTAEITHITSESIMNDSSIIQNVSRLAEEREIKLSDGNMNESGANVCILRVLESEAMQHIPQQSDSGMEHRRLVAMEEQKLALEEINNNNYKREERRTHKIIDSRHSMGMSGSIPSIPCTNRKYNTTNTVTITRTNLTNELESVDISPTFTFSLPKYVRNSNYKRHTLV